MPLSCNYVVCDQCWGEEEVRYSGSCCDAHSKVIIVDYMREGYYKIQGVLLPNTGKYGAVSRLIWGETLAKNVY